MPREFHVENGLQTPEHWREKHCDDPACGQTHYYRNQQGKSRFGPGDISLHLYFDPEILAECASFYNRSASPDVEAIRSAELLSGPGARL